MCCQTGHFITHQGSANKENCAHTSHLKNSTSHWTTNVACRRPALSSSASTNRAGATENEVEWLHKLRSSGVLVGSHAPGFLLYFLNLRCGFANEAAMDRLSSGTFQLTTSVELAQMLPPPGDGCCLGAQHLRRMLQVRISRSAAKALLLPQYLRSCIQCSHSVHQKEVKLTSNRVPGRQPQHRMLGKSTAATGSAVRLLQPRHASKHSLAAVETAAGTLTWESGRLPASEILTVIPAAIGL